VDRARAMFVIEQHQPSPLWRLLHLVRCGRCRCRGPCAPYLTARTAMLNHDRADVAALVRHQLRDDRSA